MAGCFGTAGYHKCGISIDKDRRRRVSLEFGRDGETGLETEVIKRRYGLSDGYIHSYEEIGEQFRTTPEKVAEIKKRAVEKLRSTNQKREADHGVSGTRSETDECAGR